MDKRYQVFVSSTYTDLKEERQHVIQTLMEMDCIPSGMELFPALDEEQFEFIKRVINDCDYYLLVVGGRYGSVTAEGLSYTEKEYDYAVSIGLKVIAFLHENPDEIAAGKTDKDPELAQRLSIFRGKVEQGRLVKYWRAPSDLPGLVALSLSKTIKTYPAVGWVRANAVGSNELLSELNAVRKENEELRIALSKVEDFKKPDLSNLATLEDSFTLRGKWRQGDGYSWRRWDITLTWAQIFALIAPDLMVHPNDSSVALRLRKALIKQAGIEAWESKLDDHDFQTVKLQFKALGLTKVTYAKATNGTMGLFWSLTSRGEALMLELRAVRAAG